MLQHMWLLTCLQRLPAGSYQSSLSPVLIFCAQFCLRHSATARRLRFLRKVPPLRGLADAALLAAAASMTEHEFAVSPANKMFYQLAQRACCCDIRLKYC